MVSNWPVLPPVRPSRSASVMPRSPITVPVLLNAPPFSASARLSQRPLLFS
ncbi:hypothetical protein V6M93_21905 [Pectobacterium brasiliense]|uniref:hypothetical protein n=1 Tax=Pectobacterium brasiliense TaxID=180957 RepID=UPI00366FE452